MSSKTYYLELSQESGGSHKFYEVIVENCELTIKYGRIGTNGQSSTKAFDSFEKADKEAQKKVKSKKKKGYEDAVKGVRKKRPITRRTIVSHNSTSKKSPILWKFQSGADAFGIFVDEDSCWVGNQKGDIFNINHDGDVLNQFRLKDGVKCIVSDGKWLYAGCDDGCVYDLTGKYPRVAYEVEENIDIYWIDIHDGVLGVSDEAGNVLITNYEDESINRYKSKGVAGWMIRCDKDRVYHGHSNGVTAYNDWDDSEHSVTKDSWSYQTAGRVLFGWQEGDTLYAGTLDRKVYAISKEGKLIKTYDCDASIYSCATSKNGEYIFAGDSYSSIYCFNKEGERLWKLATTCGSAYSMQYLNEKLYIVTTRGYFTCIDASPEAIERAKEGVVPVAKDIKAPKSITVKITTTLEITTDSSNGVVLKCIKEGSKLRVRVVSDGFNKDWNVQFPKNLREEGALYWVQELYQSNNGNFYRVYGDIKKLQS